ncbi:MAG TPA: hypothetical protein ENI87_04390 [bacterium]|nr:hypothetical protein [bacterium]
MSGLRPRIPQSCRAALRELLNGGEAPSHVESCSFCAARVRAAGPLSRWLGGEFARTPAMPSADGVSAELDSIYERATERAEAGALGRWVESAAVEPPNVAGLPSGEDVQQASLTRDPLAGSGLAESLVRAPSSPPPSVWSGVRRSILADVQAERAVRLRSRTNGLRMLLVGAAASFIVGLVVIASESPEPPSIQFVDLDRAPDSPFATARYGSRQ